MSDDIVRSLGEALKSVIDPELGYNIVDIGLVYDVDVHDGHARILLTTTTPGCPATNYIRQAVESAAASVPGISDVDVTMTWQPRWSTDRMSEPAKAHLGIPARAP
ncbi:MAG: metal-sulfur cluster assembly factor [Stellaceae bacterium]